MQKFVEYFYQSKTEDLEDRVVESENWLDVIIPYADLMTLLLIFFVFFFIFSTFEGTRAAKVEEEKMAQVIVEPKVEVEKPAYYEDTHVVAKGENLSIISGYEHIYNDPEKWGIIYRANRDILENPNLIYANLILKIPRNY